MAEKQSAGSSIPWPAVIGLLLAVGGATFFINTLRSDRPATSARNQEFVLGHQDVPARLWQDPFEAMADATKDANEASRTKPPRHSAEELRAEIDKHLAQSAEPICVLGVLVPASSYAESVEQRLRSRCAVLSGMGRSGYIAVDGEHIGFIKIPWTRAEFSNEAEADSVLLPDGKKDAEKLASAWTIPYEWCKKAALPIGTTRPQIL